MNDFILYYQLKYDPFVKKEDIFIELTDYKELHIRFEYLLRTRGIGVFTGGAGRGKTYALRKHVEQLNPNLYKVCYLTLSTITVNEFYRSLALELGLEPFSRKVDNFRQIQIRLEELAQTNKQLPLIIIDEAHFLKTSILQDLIMLLNFKMDSTTHAVFILAGMPSLQTTLSRAPLEPLRQRIISQYQLMGIDNDEVKVYLTEKLRAAGRETPLFTDDAMTALAQNAGGSMRTLNNLASHALLIGATQQVPTIDAEIILMAHQELSFM